MVSLGGGRGGALTKLLPIGVGRSKTRNSKLRRTQHGEGINQLDFQPPLMLIGLLPILNYTVIQHRVAKGAIPY